MFRSRKIKRDDDDEVNNDLQTEAPEFKRMKRTMPSGCFDEGDDDVDAPITTLKNDAAVLPVSAISIESHLSEVVNDILTQTVNAAPQELPSVNPSISSKYCPPQRSKEIKMDWDASEDTAEQDELFQTGGLSLAMGRGHRAGEFDSRFESAASTGVDSSWETKPVEDMTNRDWRIMREAAGIVVKGRQINPARTWTEMALPEGLAFHLSSVLKFSSPSGVQKQTIPAALAFRDVLGVAATGSGKTAAFLLPFLALCTKLEPLHRHPHLAADGPYGLVLAPSRELAVQIQTESDRLSQPLIRHERHQGVVRESRNRGVSSLVVVGGRSKQQQQEQLTEGCDLVVATPGRLVELLEEQVVVLNQLLWLVLDEADKMLEDRSFEADLGVIIARANEEVDRKAAACKNGLADGKVLETIEAKAVAAVTAPGVRLAKLEDLCRVTLLFSATLAPKIEGLAKQMLKGPCEVYVGAWRKQTGAVGRKDILQEVKVVRTEAERLQAVLDVFVKGLGGKGRAEEEEEREVRVVRGRGDDEDDEEQEGGDELSSAAIAAPQQGGKGRPKPWAGKGPAIVFANTKSMVERVSRAINEKLHALRLPGRAVSLHSDKTQDAREEALQQFREGRAQILVATDVAGRGIDVKGVRLVVNFDMPSSVEQYTHRIGRTGRAGETGHAITVLNFGDVKEESDATDTELLKKLKEFLVASGCKVPGELLAQISHR